MKPEKRVAEGIENGMRRGIYYQSIISIGRGLEHSHERGKMYCRVLSGSNGNFRISTKAGRARP